MEDMRNSYKILIGTPEGKRPLERTRCKWEYNIRMYLREIGCEGMDCTHLAKDRDPWRSVVKR
jgi:hypothetical protein